MSRTPILLISLWERKRCRDGGGSGGERIWIFRSGKYKEIGNEDLHMVSVSHVRFAYEFNKNCIAGKMRV